MRIWLSRKITVSFAYPLTVKTPIAPYPVVVPFVYALTSMVIKYRGRRDHLRVCTPFTQTVSCHGWPKKKNPNAPSVDNPFALERRSATLISWTRPPRPRTAPNRLPSSTVFPRLLPCRNFIAAKKPPLPRREVPKIWKRFDKWIKWNGAIWHCGITCSERP